MRKLMKAELNIVSGLGRIDVEKCLEVVCRIMQRHFDSTKGFKLYGKSVDLAQAGKVLYAGNRKPFLLEGQGWRFHRMTVRNHSIDAFTIEADFEVLNPELWVGELVREFPITQAWVVDAEYDFWQNAEDPIEFTANGRSWEHLPKRSNGLPPPLEQVVVDTSENPGRRVIKDGYIEAIGSPMWLGSDFWKKTRTEKKSVSAEKWLNGVEEKCGLLRIEPYSNLFTSPDGDSAKIQERLRSLLFGTAKVIQ